MKIVLSIFLMLFFASSVSADVYKWIDENGAVNFTDDFSQVPSKYQDKVEKVSIPKSRPSTSSEAPSGKMAPGASPADTARKAPAIAQTLVREGDFAIKLVEALKMGWAESEAEAENMLASSGITPRNGWIADYPVTPDIIGELQLAIGLAADSGNLRMKKDEAMMALQDLAVQQGLPVQPDIGDQHAGVEPSGDYDYGDYSNPSVINNYYYNEGPPVVTYYPPPPDYSYLYAWVPSRFWCGGFFYPGFFVLRDFHRAVFVNKRRAVISNHFRDRRTGRFSTVDPARRQHGGTRAEFGDAGRRSGMDRTEAREGARAIFDHSRKRTISGRPSAPITNPGGLNRMNPPSFRPGHGTGTQSYNRESRGTNFNRQGRDYGRSPVTGRGMNRVPGEVGRRMGDRSFNRPGSGISSQTGTSFQRPFTGEMRSFSPPPQGRERSFSQPSRGGAPHFSPLPTGSRGSPGGHQGVGHGTAPRPGGLRF